ncbi:metallophosphoesterase family protein [Calycomorphotria hydatis]|uniref:Phosphoesterase n=1 Tax=Calycomorphotria hydatis TaxID=2528027 RepID=A0A517T585_9PLAN|nr:YfcE family phosphodiesterase [Calycomorphotria hydatis]QDT63542.1 phosphodiesterase [Calycomorphotria hydatis]
MKLAVISDTHGHVPYTTDAVREIERISPDVVIHCGDIGSPDVVHLLTGRPTHFVFGNVDRDTDVLRYAIRLAELECHDRFGELTLDGINIAFLHGDDEDLLRQTIRSGDYQLVCHGHTHQQRCEKIGDTLVLNPGAMYRASVHSIAIVDLPELSVEFVTVEHG